MSSALFSQTFEVDVLAALMESADCYDTVAEIITADDFFIPTHAVMFKSIAWLAKHNQPHDAACVAHFLSKHGKLDAIGGEAVIGSIVAVGSWSTANIAIKAREIRSLSVGRSLISACNTIRELVENPTKETNIENLLDRAESAVLSIKDGLARDSAMGPRHLKDVLSETIEILDKRSAGAMGLDTGFVELNQVLTGLHKKTLIIVAAVPGMGKTTFAMNMVENAIRANSMEGAAAIFSMEMGDTDIAERMISSVGGINQHKMRISDLDGSDWHKMQNAITDMRGWPVYIDETPSLNLMEMRTRLRRMARNHGGKIGVVLVDYLQLMRAVERQPDRQREVAEVAVGLKSISKEFDCPVIALSQLNRKIGERPNKRPVMSDLRESGYIEQAADVILFIYRDEKYNIDSKDKGMAEIIIGKQRKGEADRKVVLAFDGANSRFMNPIGGGYAY